MSPQELGSNSSLDQTRQGRFHPQEAIANTGQFLREGQIYLSRQVLARVVSLLPREIVDEEQARKNIEKLLELRHKGYGTIIPYLHFSRRETAELPAALVLMDRSLMGANFLEPVALHQNNLLVRGVAKTVDMGTRAIVTKETKAKGKNTVKPSLRSRAQYAIISRFNPDAEKPATETLIVTHGTREFLADGSDALGRGDIILIAPQGGRGSSLGRPNRAVGRLIEEARSRGVEKIVVMPISIALKDVSQYGDDTKGVNLLKTQQYAIHEPRTDEEYAEYASGNGLTFDEQIFTDIASILPDSYRNS